MNNISWWRTNFTNGEAKQISEAIANEHISQGALTEQFERQLAKELNVPYVVVTTSGSIGLLMAMMAIGIQPGDEIIVPNRTWIATAHSPMILGAKVVLVDVLPNIPVMDVTQVRKKITSRTKAIIPVHLNGRSVEMVELDVIAKEYGLSIVEDACQALFSKNADGFLGTLSDIGCFSLGVSKLISTGQGGVVVTRDQDTYEKLKLIRNHGTTTNIDPSYNLLGCNFKFTDLLASIGMVQLAQAKQRINNVNQIYTKYSNVIDVLPDIDIIPVDTSDGEIPLYVEVLCQHRNKLIDFLNAQRIEIRPSLPSLHSVPYFETSDKFLNSKIFEEQGIILPCGPAQSLENINCVIEALELFGRENR